MKTLNLVNELGKKQILLPINLENKHWVGIVLKYKSDKASMFYMDPQNNEIPDKLLFYLAKCCAFRNLKISYYRIKVEQQKYNNCGAEMIENFIYFLTGKRRTQESALEHHSILYERHLLDNIDNKELLIKK